MSREEANDTGKTSPLQEHETGKLFNSHSLEWVLEIIQYPLYYPALAEKAAVLAWTIINSHVFYDGCKRTGMATLVTFLRQNGYDLNAATEEIVDVSVKIAKHAEENYTRQEFVQWVRERLSLTVIEW